jgi:CRISPR-associated endonuclease Cas2
MVDRKINVIIAYDIHLQKVRTKIADLLIEFGLERVNKSVFEGELHQMQFLKRLKPLLISLKKDDSIIIYTVNGEVLKQKELFVKKARRKRKNEPRIV